MRGVAGVVKAGDLTGKTRFVEGGHGDAWERREGSCSDYGGNKTALWHWGQIKKELER